MVSALSSVLIWGATLVLLLRIISSSGIDFPDNRFFCAILKYKGISGCFKAERTEIFRVFLLALLFRITIFLISILAIGMFRTETFSFDTILRGYLQWDTNNYIRIAEGGYKGYTVNGDYSTLVFFPLYPWVMRLFKTVFVNSILSGIILSSLLYCGACCFLYAALAEDFNRETARRALIFISVFPHAMFFGAAMNESMLLFNMCATFYYIRKHNWILTGIFGALAALSRLAGILMAVPAAVEWLEHYRIIEKIRKKEIAEVWRLFRTKGLWIFLMLAGVGIYLWCNYATTGEWFKFLEYQDKYWQQKNCYFGNGITIIFKNAITSAGENRFVIWVCEAAAVIFAVSMLMYGLRRIRNMYSAFLIIYIIINTGITWPLSMGRYMSCAVPAFIALSVFTGKHKWTEPFIIAAMSVTMGVIITAYVVSKQIL